MPKKVLMPYKQSSKKWPMPMTLKVFNIDDSKFEQMAGKNSSGWLFTKCLYSFE